MLDPRREKLLKDKLGDLLTWTKPVIVETVGPYDPTAFDEYDAYRQRVIADCAAKLEAYTEDQVLILLGETRDEDEEALVEWRRFADDRIRKCVKESLPWYAGGFGHPDHGADFTYWSKMASFTIHELLCLSVGVEPDSFDSSTVARFSRFQKSALDAFWPAMAFLARRREQLVRQFSGGDDDRRVSPKQFLAWIEKTGFETHPAFLDPLQGIHVGDVRPASGPAEPTRQDPREVDTIAQLFTAMAIKRYRYDPRAERSEVPRKISDLAASMGMTVTPETVRKYLKKGAELIPSDWEPE